MAAGRARLGDRGRSVRALCSKRTMEGRRWAGVRQGLGAVLWAHRLQQAGCPRLCGPQGAGRNNTHSLRNNTHSVQCRASTKRPPAPEPNRPTNAHLRARGPAAWATARGMHCGCVCKVTGWGGDEG